MARGYKGRVVTQAEASRRWKLRNPEKVRAYNARPRKRVYESEASRARRLRRLAQPGYAEKIRAQARQRLQAVRDWLAAFKVERGCIDCGFNQHHAGLDFDHVSGKKSFNVCNAKSVAQAQREIEHCVVRCARCHRIRSWERLQVKKAKRV